MTGHRRSGRRVTGLILFATGCGLIVVNRAAALVFPSSWGGPNIGGGFINLVAVPVAIVGLVLMLAGSRLR